MLIAMWMIASGCASEPAPGPPTSWQDPQAFTQAVRWQPGDLSADPLASHQGPSTVCGLAGWRIEGEDLEIDTGACDYGYFIQTPLLAAPAYSKVLGTYRHYDLTAPEPAAAHAALLFDDEIAWEWETPIEGGSETTPADVHAFEFQVPEAVAADVVVAFHLHNHGQNNHLLSQVRVALPAQ